MKLTRACRAVALMTAGFALTAGLSSCSAGADVPRDYPAASPTDDVEVATSAPRVPLGEEVSRQSRSAALTRVECGLAELADGGVVRTPAGQFCRATIALGNDADAAATFSVASLTALVGVNSYPADAVTSAYLGQNPLVQIGPSQRREVPVYFDVPQHTSSVDAVVLAPGWLPRQVTFAAA